MADFGSSDAGRKGGNERARRLSKEERSEIARRAATARWTNHKEEGLPQALCGGVEPLLNIPCYVLEEGAAAADEDRRVIRIDGFQTALGMRPGGGTTRLAEFARRFQPKSGPGSDLSARLESPVEFVPPNGGIARGYPARVLRELCDAVLEARRIGALTPRYYPYAEAAESLIRGFAAAGLVALIDDATGYTKLRHRLALAAIVDKYVAKELQGWTKTFPDDYCLEIYRLKKWDYSQLKPGDPKPKEIACITVDYVYRRLAPGIVDELRRLNPYIVPGRRLHKHHEWLTRDIGHSDLKAHVTKIVTIMKLSDDWMHFERNLQRVMPQRFDQPFFNEFFTDEP